MSHSNRAVKFASRVDGEKSEPVPLASRVLQTAACKNKALSQPKPEDAAPGLTFHYKFSYLQTPRHWGTETKSAPTSHVLPAPEVFFTCGKGEEAQGTSELEGLSPSGRAWELEVTRRWTYNVKYKSARGWRGLGWTSRPTAQARVPQIRRAPCEKGKSQHTATFSANVLDALFQLTDAHSSKSRCPELNLPTSGWWMWIICVFCEINAWCCQSE